MSPIRPLLRLDEKVAAETRRLASLGGPRGWAAGIAALLGAVALHGALLALPLTSRASPAERLTPRPDLPSVWRWGPPLSGDPAAAPPAAPAPTPAPAPSRLRSTAVEPNAEADYEPVPEPLPELTSTAFPADVDALIPAPQPAPSGSDDAGPRAGDPVAPPADPAPIFRVSPVYPRAALALQAEGVVTLNVGVAADGSVEEAGVESCTRPGLGFEDAALTAVRRWRYPASPDGSSVRRIAVRIEFSLRGQR